MKGHRNTSHEITGGPTLELISMVERYVYRSPLCEDENLIFQEINQSLIDYALDAIDISPNTALHRVLDDLAYIRFYEYSYDDLDWINDESDFANYAITMFKHMNALVPTEFHKESPKDIMRAREKYRHSFLTGLNVFVNSAFAQLWFRKAFLFKFNELLAASISKLLKSDYPMLEQDGRIPRAKYFHKWIDQSIVRREGGLCHYCKNVVASPSLDNQNYDIDHMVPIAKGGTNDPTNLVLSCKKCNNKKGAKYIYKPDAFLWPKRTKHSI
ncbi:HNH endonuclease [Serratia ureilytica]|uniref:HNH endonuclease n=1 Tax=Serratia ureilytica TaxID=300181 RepID=UPI0018E836C8|nr:HNH endonuclease [Serratia ureilytica]MBJ2099272.1 HNH endonuclease [Serratia ureilytica]